MLGSIQIETIIFNKVSSLAFVHLVTYNFERTEFGLVLWTIPIPQVVPRFHLYQGLHLIKLTEPEAVQFSSRYRKSDFYSVSPYSYGMAPPLKQRVFQSEAMISRVWQLLRIRSRWQSIDLHQSFWDNIEFIITHRILNRHIYDGLCPWRQPIYQNGVCNSSGQCDCNEVHCQCITGDFVQHPTPMDNPVCQFCGRLFSPQCL